MFAQRLNHWSTYSQVRHKVAILQQNTLTMSSGAHSCACRLWSESFAAHICSPGQAALVLQNRERAVGSRRMTHHDIYVQPVSTLLDDLLALRAQSSKVCNRKGLSDLSCRSCEAVMTEV